jgi:hypothetical protein
VFPDPTDLCRGKTILFEVMSQGADDARAGGSDRDEEHGIHLILPEQTCQSMRHSLHSTEMRRSNLGVLNRHHAANNTLASRGARMGGGPVQAEPSEFSPFPQSGTHQYMIFRSSVLK